jgi:hypothetical protein
MLFKGLKNLWHLGIQILVLKELNVLFPKPTTVLRKQVFKGLMEEQYRNVNSYAKSAEIKLYINNAWFLL